MKAVRASLLFALALSITACSKKETADEKPAAGDAAASYTTRGLLKEKAEASVTIHHEAIPEFVGRKGKPSPMMSMSMPFGVAEGVSLAELTPGDKVEFTFRVDFKQNPPTSVTAIKTLPADTELSISGH